MIGLRWVDVDLSAGRINVRQSIVRGVIGLPKSGKPREIALGDDVIEALGAHHHERGPLVFCDAEGKPLTSGLLAWPLKRALKRAGLREIGWHVLRHTVASHLAMRGVPLKVVQELLGHSSIRTRADVGAEFCARVVGREPASSPTATCRRRRTCARSHDACPPPRGIAYPPVFAHLFLSFLTWRRLRVARN